MKKFIFDIDGTICTNTYGKYDEAEPFLNRINFINNLYKSGNIIKFFTARGSTTNINWRDLTEKQLSRWGVKYHELIMGKPEGDFYIDDKGFNCNNEILPLLKEFNKNKSVLKNSGFLKDEVNIFMQLLHQISEDSLIQDKLSQLINDIEKCFNKNGKLIFAGNGGSFADAQHLSAEFVSKFTIDRQALPSVALGTNSSNLTSIGNDYGFEYVFSRELEAIGTKKDLLIAITTSGNSKNIINLIDVAEQKGIKFYILTGKTGGKLSNYKDNLINVPSENTALIQQSHIFLGHIICKNSELNYL